MENAGTFRKAPLPELKAVFSKWQTAMDGKAWNSLYWTNHDQPRTVSRRGDDGRFRKESQENAVYHADDAAGDALHLPGRGNRH